MADNLQDLQKYREMLLEQRGTYARNPFIDRDSEESYQRAVHEKEDLSTFQKITKIGALGLAAYALGRTVPKDIWVEAAHRLGVYGKSVFGRYMEARNQIVLQTAERQLAKRGATSELSEFVESEARPFLQDIEAGATSTDARQRALRLTREQLQQKFGRSHPGLQKYTGLTFSDVMAMRASQGEQFKVISTQAYDSIMQMRSKLDPSGEWFDKLLVDRHLYKARTGLVGQGIVPSHVLDTRWTSMRAFGQMAYNSLGFQIPFVGFRPVDLVAPFFRLFSEGRSLARVGLGQKIASDIVAPRTGITYMIGGKVMHFGSTGVVDIAPGRVFKAQKIDSLAEANLAILGIHPAQRASLAARSGVPRTRQDFFSKLQDLIGFGPKFRSQPWVPGMVMARAKERRAIRAGEAFYKAYQNVEQHDLPFFQKLRRQIDIEAAGQQYKPGDIVPNPYAGKPLAEQPFVERVKQSLGVGELGEVVSATQPTRQYRTPGWFSGTSRIKPSPLAYGRREIRPGELLKGFGGEEFAPVENFIYENKLSNKLAMTAHFATNRLNDLIGATIGVGFRPSAGKFGWLINAAKIGAIGAVFNPINGYLIEAASYMNYLFKQATNLFGIAPWDGFSPTDIGLKAFEGITLGASVARDTMGITSTAKYLEDLMPGLINSPLSGIVRTLLPTTGLGMKFGPRGVLAGLTLASLTGGISDIFGVSVVGAGLTTTSKELSEMYSGDRLSPVRKSRWWMLGRSSFYGEGIDRYEPHWVALAKSDYKYTDVLYGSQAEYFRHVSSLPTPHNLFGLLDDEDYYANKLSRSRPYPIAPSGKEMHAGEMWPFTPQLTPGVTPGDLNAIGYGVPTPYTKSVGSEEGLGYTIKDKLNTITEFLGIYKFMGQSMFFGEPRTAPVLESASNITSDRRLYWDKDLGGLFGMTELLRRYFPKPNDIGTMEYVNQIPNLMPSFMPGARSAYEADRTYPLDFTLGDPYSKVKGGEYRLPGSGYEATHRLHSNQKGVYDVVDAFMILSDVAPFSEAYKEHKRNVFGMLKNNELDSYWAERVQQSVQQRDDKLKGYALDFAHRKFTGFDTSSDISDINKDVKYNAAERIIGSAWERLTLDALPEVGRIVPFGTLITHKLFPHHTPEQDYLERQVLGSRNSNWADPWEGFVAPKYGTLVNENPITATLGGGLAAALTATNPLSAVSRGILGGMTMASMSTLRAVQAGRIEGGYKPSFREREEEVIDYFDKLEYLRYQNAINQAMDVSRPDIAGNLRREQSKRTMAGLNLMQPNRLRFSFGALPKPERFYYEDFINAPPEERQNILDMVPKYMGNIYQSIWEQGSVMRNNVAEIRSFMQNNSLPDKSWGGWNLGIQKWQIMSKTMDTPDNSVAIDLHRQHISNNMIYQSEMNYPGLGLELQNLIGDSTMEHTNRWVNNTREKINTIEAGMRSGLRDIRVSSSYQGSVDRRPFYRSRYRHDRRGERDARITEMVR